MNCPNCGLDVPDQSLECRGCGIIFAKIKARPPLAGLPGSKALPAAPADALSLGRAGWTSLLAGLFLAALVFLVPALNFIFQALLILVHELGHAAAGWAFGYASIPAFDFAYGGGVTLHQERSMLLVALVYALMAGAAWALRRNGLAVHVIAVAAVLYTVLAITPAHQFLTVLMGHGSELAISAVFLSRSMGGWALAYPIERPLYGFAGFFILLADLKFSYRLWSSEASRWEYRQAKGGGDWMDFSKISRDFLHTDLETVAMLFFLLCLLTPVAAFLAFRYRKRVVGFTNALLSRD